MDVHFGRREVHPNERGQLRDSWVGSILVETCRARRKQLKGFQIVFGVSPSSVVSASFGVSALFRISKDMPNEDGTYETVKPSSREASGPPHTNAASFAMPGVWYQMKVTHQLNEGTQGDQPPGIWCAGFIRDAWCLAVEGLRNKGARDPTAVPRS